MIDPNAPKSLWQQEVDLAVKALHYSPAPSIFSTIDVTGDWGDHAEAGSIKEADALLQRVFSEQRTGDETV